MILISKRHFFAHQLFQWKILFFLLIFLCLGIGGANAQMKGLMNRLPGAVSGATRSGGGGGGGGKDSLSFEKRKFSDDSVNVRFRYLDTARFSGFDSTIDDYFRRVPLKPEYIYLGNNGTATRQPASSPAFLNSYIASAGSS